MEKTDSSPGSGFGITLSQYFAMGNSQTDFADRVGVTQGAASQWALHTSKPKFSRCKDIFRETGGLVTGVEWFPEEKTYFEMLVRQQPSALNESAHQEAS